MSRDFSRIGFEDFRRMAKDPGLSMYERIGFPDSYRKGYEQHIFEDILAKLPRLRGPAAAVLDIGPGCSELPGHLVATCRNAGHQLELIDSEEMLSQLPDDAGIRKTPAIFPNCPELLERLRGKVDCILCYSVLHYAFVDTPIHAFWDSMLSLLAPGGRCLVGDIPNISRRKRFFASEAGVRFHKAFMATEEAPQVEFNQLEPGQLDDAVLTGLLMRARAAGFDAWIVPQAPSLPMANRREDILVERP